MIKGIMRILDLLVKKYNVLRREDPGMLVFAGLIGLFTGILTVSLIFLLEYLSHFIYGVDEPGIQIAARMEDHRQIMTMGGLHNPFLPGKDMLT